MARKFQALAKSMPQRRRLVILGAIFLLALGFAACRLIEYLSQGAGLPCLFRSITGISCPGCGNTHAMIALSHGDFLSGLSYNLLYPLEFAYLLWLFIYASRQYVLRGRFCYAGRILPIDWIVLALILIWWVLRNLLSL